MNSLDLLSENYNFEGSANMLKNKVIVKKSAFAKHSL